MTLYPEISLTSSPLENWQLTIDLIDHEVQTYKFLCTDIVKVLASGFGNDGKQQREFWLLVSSDCPTLTPPNSISQYLRYLNVISNKTEKRKNKCH